MRFKHLYERPLMSSIFITKRSEPVMLDVVFNKKDPGTEGLGPLLLCI